MIDHVVVKLAVLTSLVFVVSAGSSTETVSRRKMTADESTACIAASPLEAEIARIVDLQVIASPESPIDDHRIEPSGSRRIATDGAGGVFHVLADGRILLIDSEGWFGVVGSDFRQFIAIATGLPDWRDALRFTKDANLEHARLKWRGFVGQFALDRKPDAPWPYPSAAFSVATPAAVLQAIRTQFGVAAAIDPFADLYGAVNRLGKDVSVRSGDDARLPFGSDR